jgi:glyoxylase-like metal-dependent hydrolase (beta-lactamase superfamily II)
MHIRRTQLFGAFLCLLALGGFLTRGDAQPNTIKQIVPGVWFREGDIEHQGHCNNTIIEMSDYLIVVDANFPSGARAVIEDAKRVSSKPIRFVFDTHHHGDHAYGNPVWTKMGAVTVAFQGVAEEMKRYEPARWQQMVKQRKDVAELGRDMAEPPKQTWPPPSHVISDSFRRVEFHFFGWAHTRGDGFVYIPKDRVLCTGDAIVNGPYNYTADGNIANWPEVIRKAQKLDVQYVLPGHGPSGGREVMDGQRQFFIELRKAVQQAIKGGKKLDDIVSLKSNQAPSTTIQLSARVKNWVGNGLAGQVRDAYNELTQNKPAGDLPHP